MSLYTFYPCSPEGLSATFRTFDLASDEAATERAREMLAEHRSCASVVIWTADRKVAVQRREDCAA